jgi:hypothetical protein
MYKRHRFPKYHSVAFRRKVRICNKSHS